MRAPILKISGGRAVKSPIGAGNRRRSFNEGFQTDIASCVLHARDMVRAGQPDEAVYILEELLHQLDPDRKLPW